jgi:hypothetical protein
MASPLEPSAGQMRWVWHAAVDFAVTFIERLAVVLWYFSPAVP